MVLNIIAICGTSGPTIVMFRVFSKTLEMEFQKCSSVRASADPGQNRVKFSVSDFVLFDTFH